MLAFDGELNQRELTLLLQVRMLAFDGELKLNQRKSTLLLQVSPVDG